MIAGAATGIGAMTVVMSGPLTSVLLTVVFLSADAITLTPLVIVTVVVAHVSRREVHVHPFGRMLRPQ